MNYAGKNIRVSNEVHEAIVNHISEALKIGKWVENAIKEKIERDNDKNNYIFGKVDIPALRDFEKLQTKSE